MTPHNVLDRRDTEQTAVSELLDTISLYLHIPFCHAKCHYCDFNSYAGMLGLREQYVAALADEIRFAGARVRHPSGALRRCRTIFFGGGTPSLLTADQVGALLDATRESFALDDQAEITLEANPGTLEYGHLDDLRAAGINRLSMGAQSFDAGLLRWMGRIHTPEEVESAVAAARAAGFDNLNLDFIYALPGQSLATWQSTLDRALLLRPEHLSLYSLIVEEGTPLYRWVEKGRVKPADEDLAADMYEYAAERLAAAGYRQYEVSNWALEGQACEHNLTYWHNLPYIGLGAGASSWYGQHRFTEVKPVRSYLARVAEARAADSTTDGSGVQDAVRLPAAAVHDDEVISRALEMGESAMLGLRLTDGLSESRFAERFGVSFDTVYSERLADVRAFGLVETVDGRVRLTTRGRLLGNEVFERVLPTDDAPSV